VRVLLLLTTFAGFFGVFSVGFPPAARDRLPVLVLAVALALASAWSPGRGLLVFSFLFPFAGAGGRIFGGSEAVAWPVLLLAGFAAGWTFRFLYDFESAPDSSRVDSTLKALAAVWSLSAVLAMIRARTLWALAHGLGLRAVNGEGLLDAAAIRESMLCLAVLAAGVGYFFILRRAGEALRARSMSAALAGVGVSAALAVAQRLTLAPVESKGFWSLTGRLSGGAVDPNALGLLCGLGLVLLMARWRTVPTRRVRAAGLAMLLSAGLVLSGSRSGLLLSCVGLLALVLAPGGAARRHLMWAGLGFFLLVGIAVVSLRGVPGSIGSRLAEAFDPRLPIEYRASARPLLWESAIRLFERHPLAGAGMGAFSWQLPDLLTERGRSLPMRDNPGNAYLQALAETGLIGFLLTMAFAFPLFRYARSGAGGSGAAVVAFLIALATGSHWFAPDVALFFFLLVAEAVPAQSEKSAKGPRWLRGVLVTAYAGAVIWGALATLSPDVAFRHRQGIGFHAKEIGRGGPFYWTERRFAIRLEPGQTMRLRLAHFTPEGRNVELTAESGGGSVYRRELQPGQTVGLLLNGRPSEAVVIRFSLSRAFVPKRLGLSADRRELGLVAVFSPQP
jgi:O-antigen ligase